MYVPVQLDERVGEACEREAARLTRAYTYTDFVVDAIRERLGRLDATGEAKA